MSKFDLENEWALLQNQFDSYEKFSLVIKLFAVGVLALAFNSNTVGAFIVFVLLVLWIQDAIWNTFQSRIETRLLKIEVSLTSKDGVPDIAACQFNSEYLETRPGTVGLLFEYLNQAVRPTVAFPHCVLVLAGVFAMFGSG